MNEVCENCGFFISYMVPKEPAVPGWVHSRYAPEKPARPFPCTHPAPPAGHADRTHDAKEGEE